MNHDSRVKKSIRNFKYGLIAQIIQYTLSFATRTIFIKYLTAEFLGMNSLITNILLVLSLAESGMGGAFQVSLYKSLHEKDEAQTASIMAVYRKIFFILGFFILSIGLLLIPFLGLMVTEDLETFRIIYVLFLFGSTVSYIANPFRTIIRADQKNYIITFYNQIIIIIKYALQIFVLVLTQNFILYIAVQVLSDLLLSYIITRKAKKMYPKLNEKAQPLDGGTKKDIKQKIYAGFFHHGGYIVNNGTDNLVITYFLGLSIVGYYSNYLLIIGILKKIFMTIFNSYSASVGNQVSANSVDDNYKMFKRISFFNFLFMGFMCICFYNLINPFISLWIGDVYKFDDLIVLLITLMFFFDSRGARRSIWLYKNATGLFYKDKYVSLLEGILNIILSILLVKTFGIVGVFIGTIGSYLLTAFLIEPHIVFNYYFKKPTYKYFLIFLKYFIIIIITGILVIYFTSFFNNDTWFSLLTNAIITGILATMLLVIPFFKTDEFKYFLKLAFRVLKIKR